MDMKKMNNCCFYLMASVLFLSSAQAGIQALRSPQLSGGSSGRATSSVTVTPGKVYNEKISKIEGTALAACKHDPAAAVYFPQSFFEAISRDGSPLKFEMRPDNTILIKVPASISVCGKFKPQMIQDPDTKNVTILMQHEDGKSYSEFLACLEKENILKDGKIDHDKIEGKNYSDYPYVLNYSFDKTKDFQKSPKLSFGSPVEFNDKADKDFYPSNNGFENDFELPSSLCMKPEKIDSGSVYLNEGKDFIIGKINEACKSNDAEKIAGAMTKALGNKDALKGILDKVLSEVEAQYLVAVKKDVKEIYEKMDSIEARLAKEKDTLEESSAKKLTNQYLELAKTLNTKLLDPSIERLDSLMQKSAAMDSEDPKRKDIDAEIKQLNEDIGSFAARKNGFPPLYAVMEKFALNDQAKSIENIRLKSHIYASVFPGPAESKRGKPLTFEAAVKKQNAGVGRFEKVLSDWTDQFLVKNGNPYPLQRVKNEQTKVYTAMNSRWNNYQKNEQAKLQQYCGMGMTGSMKNPVQCKAFQAGTERRRTIELKRREKDLAFINSRNNKLGKMGNAYAEYERKKVTDDMNTGSNSDDEPYDTSDLPYTSDFSDNFPGYYGANEPYTPYDQSRYSMGPQNSAMNMGQTMANNPMMVNPQMPIQQGQFQMQQSWPSL